MKYAKVMLVLLAITTAQTSLADSFIATGKIRKIVNGAWGGNNFLVYLEPGYSNPCGNDWVGFDMDDARKELFQRHFSLLTLAYSTKKNVTLIGADSQDCNSAFWIAIEDE